MCRYFFTYPLGEEEHKGFVSRDNDAGQFQLPTMDNGWIGPAIKTAKEHLETLATTFKFTVAYSDFPKTENSMDSQNFSLVTLGLEKPIVCHGSGDSDEDAHNNAAFNALKQLAVLDGGISATPTPMVIATTTPGVAGGMVGVAPSPTQCSPSGGVPMGPLPTPGGVVLPMALI